MIRRFLSGHPLPVRVAFIFLLAGSLGALPAGAAPESDAPLTGVLVNASPNPSTYGTQVTLSWTATGFSNLNNVLCSDNRGWLVDGPYHGSVVKVAGVDFTQSFTWTVTCWDDFVAGNGSQGVLYQPPGPPPPPPPPPIPPPPGPCSGPSPSLCENNQWRATFHNDDGDWTIYKYCVSSHPPWHVGPGYIARFVTPDGRVPVDGLNAGHNGDFADPVNGGLAIFAFLHGRNAGPEFTWTMSTRGCAFDFGGVGVSNWSTPSVGINGSEGYYDQDVYISDTWTNPLLLIRYRWRFNSSGVRLYAMVKSFCSTIACGGGTVPYIKAPMFISNISGGASQFSSATPSHISTFDLNNVWLGPCPKGALGCRDAAYECSFYPLVSLPNTGHCFDGNRVRVRFDYGHEPNTGGCNSTNQKCFNIVARACPTNGDVQPGCGVRNWQGQGFGLDKWALDANAHQAADPDDPCAIEGQWVYSPAAGLARNWEWGSWTHSGGNLLGPTDVMTKAWDNCAVQGDAGALFRAYGPGPLEYGVFMSYSINEGWTLQ